jgi:hypothetical protein
MKPWKRNFSKAVKRAAFASCKDAAGVPRCQCGACGSAPLYVGHYDFHHLTPWEISHDSSLSNCGIWRDECHDRWTGAVDIPTIAKANRRRDAHYGTGSPPRHPMRAGRRSGVSKSFRHGLVPRLTHAQKHAAFLAGRAIPGSSPGTPAPEVLP